MPDSAPVLSAEQKASIYRSLALRDSDFIKACIGVLSETGAIPFHPDIFGDLYTKLADQGWSKIEAINHLLSCFGFSPFGRRRDEPIAYDLDQLLTFAADNDAQFVSMIVDFAADRSPSADEALQFEHQLSSGRASRRDILEEVAARSLRMIALENDKVLALPASKQGHVICEKWLGQLYLHPSFEIAADFEPGSGKFRTDGNEFFSCILDVCGCQEWQLSYNLEYSGNRPIQIEVQDVRNETPICRASSIRNLVGTQQITLNVEPGKVKVLVTCLEGTIEPITSLKPIHIKLEPKRQP